ncbi:MAG: ComEC/Rec2 family competence protein [Clostridia bacterium]|nr:ComEC/Rec2 family competence protein [Clostridia bacterium]
MQRLVNFRPVVFGGLSLAAGIIFSSYLIGFSALFALIPIGVGAAAAVIVYLINKKLSVLVFGAIFIILFSIGATEIGVIFSSYNANDAVIENVTFEGTVDEILSFNGSGSRVVLKNVVSDDFSIGSGTILSFVEGDCEIGDRYRVSATLNKVETNRENGFYFSRKIFYEAQSIGSAVNVTSSTDFFYEVRKGIRSVLKENLSEKAYAFTVAMVLGDESELDGSIYSNLKAAGVSHVFAVSGLHVTFLAAIITLLLALIKIKRFKKDIIVLILTLLYSGVCGFPVSSLRAVITFFIFGAARSFGLKRDGLNAIFLSMTAVLLAMPTTLFSYGFMLSFAAVTGIVLFGGSFRRMLGFLPSRLGSIRAVSLSAFLTTAPIIAAMTGSVSLITVVANVIMIPIVSIVYYASLLCLIVVAIVPVFSPIFIIVEALVAFITGVTGAVEFERFLLFGNVTLLFVIVYYAALIVACEKVNLPKAAKSGACIAAALSIFLFI